MATEWLWAAIDGVGPGIVDRLGRLVHDIGIIYGSEGSHQFVRWLVKMIDEKNKPGRVSKLEFLASAMMPSNVIPLSIAVTRQLLSSATDQTEDKRAGLLNSLAVDLGDAGDNAQALVTIQEAVAIRRRLAQDQPARFEPQLATSLNNLSNRLSDAGDNAQALVAIQEAVAIYRRLAQDQPARFVPRLIASLSHLALRFRDVGDESEAMEAEREAAEVHRGHPDDSGA